MIFLLYTPYLLAEDFIGKKTIDVKVAGDLRIKISNGYIFVINQIKLEQYLASVATSEMGSACPPALLEAQTIVARSWIIAASEQNIQKLVLMRVMMIAASDTKDCKSYQKIEASIKENPRSVFNL